MSLLTNPGKLKDCLHFLLKKMKKRIEFVHLHTQDIYYIIQKLVHLALSTAVVGNSHSVHLT